MIESLPANSARWPGGYSGNSPQVALRESWTGAELRGKDAAQRGQPPGGVHGTLYSLGPLGTRGFPGALGFRSQRRGGPRPLCQRAFSLLHNAQSVEDFSYLLPCNALI